jgi:hypothetical protein
MKSLFVFILIISVTIKQGATQNPEIKRTWHWYFGDGAGIDFSSGTAVADTNGHLYTSEGCASISDTSGNLLFYTDGRTVWNHLHQVMPNGTGLMGGAWGSSTQEPLSIPKPLSPNLYYLFTTDEAENYGANGMRYSIVDMSFDAGNGDVTATKNVLLFAPCTEKLAAVNHCNDTCVWVMGHEVNNNHFRAYLVTPYSIDTEAVVSTVGSPHMSNVFGGLPGVLKFSADGVKLCTTTDSSSRRIELFDFNPISGIVSSVITLSKEDNFMLAITFSPSHEKLYTGNFTRLFQYDLSSNDSSTIVSSKTLISPLSNNGFRYAENAADGKIYIIPGIMPDSTISVIEYPENPGNTCNLTLDAINLLKPSYAAGLPNIIESYFNTSDTSACLEEGITPQNNYLIEIFPNAARDWIEVRGKGIEKIKLFDLSGRMVSQFDDFAFSTEVKMDVSSFDRGCYLLSIETKQKIAIKKIILQ